MSVALESEIASQTRRAELAESKLATEVANHSRTAAQLKEEFGRTERQLGLKDALHVQMDADSAEVHKRMEEVKNECTDKVLAAQERELQASTEAGELRHEIGVAEKYLKEARQRIEVLSSELSISKESLHEATANAKVTSHSVHMLGEAHGALVASNAQLRYELDQHRKSYAADSVRWQTNFQELAAHHEHYGDLRAYAGRMTGSPSSTTAEMSPDRRQHMLQRRPISHAMPPSPGGMNDSTLGKMASVIQATVNDYEDGHGLPTTPVFDAANAAARGIAAGDDDSDGESGGFQGPPKLEHTKASE
jgi:hypothetical protein